MAGGLTQRLTRGEIRLIAFPAPDKSRPALILTRSSAIGYLTRVTVAPITSTIRDVPSEVKLGIDDGMKAVCVVNLHNVITIPRASVGKYVTTLSRKRMKEVCNAIAFSLECCRE